MNWGTKITIGLLTFMTFIVVLGVLMFRSNDDALVDTDYYEKGINYNEVYNKKQNVKNHLATPEISVVNNIIVIKFIHTADGTAKLIRTADKRMDKTLVLATDSLHQFHIPITDVASGLWKLQLDWKNNGKAYLYEKEVML